MTHVSTIQVNARLTTGEVAKFLETIHSGSDVMLGRRMLGGCKLVFKMMFGVITGFYFDTSEIVSRSPKLSVLRKF